MPTDDGFELARRQGYQQALNDVADWLETTVRGVSLFRRVELAADLRDGRWRQATRLKGLRLQELLYRRAQVLTWRGVPVRDLPQELKDAVLAERERRQTIRRDESAEVARILRDRYGLDAPQPASSEHPGEQGKTP